MLDETILERKILARDYMFPNLESGTVFYKQWKMGEKEYETESSPMEQKPTYIHITRWLKGEDGKWTEEKVVDIVCRDLTDIESAIKELEKLENGSPSAPFDMIATEKGMKFVHARKGWVKKK